MTDTSTVDQGDDADTKTTPDQPGQPDTQSQPRTWRPPPGLPTPLAVLASQLSQPQGNPAGPLPQPAPLPPFDQAQQRALKREAPYARETGAFPPYVESPVQTYVPARPIREPHQWGTSDPYPNTPATWELPGMWRGIGQTLSQIGSGNVGAIASLLAPFSADSMKSYVAGQSARIKLDHERAVDAAWETDRRLDLEIRDARDAYALFGGDITSMTGADKNLSLRGVGKFVDAQRAIAARYNDFYLQAAIDSGDMKRVENIWKERDAVSRDLKASLAQQEKDAEKRRIEQPFRIDGGPSQAGPPMGDHPNPPSIDESVPDDSTPDPGAAPSEGTGAPPASPPEDVTPPQQDISPYPDGVPDAQAQARRAQPRGVQVAQAGASDAPQPGMARLAQADAAPAQPVWQPAPSRILQDARGAGWKPDAVDAFARKAVNNPMFTPNAKGVYPGVPADMSGYVGMRAQEIQAELERIKRSNLRGKDAEDAIRAVDPSMADKIKQYVLGNAPVPQAQRFNDLAASYILPLGNKIDPTFNENTFRLRYATKKDFTSGIEGRTLTSIATAKAHLEHALQAMDHVPGYITSQVGDWRILSGVMPKSVTDEIGTLENSIHTGSNEYERALLGGKPPRGAITDTERQLDWRHTNPEVIKASLRDKISALKVRLDQLKGQFRSGFGRGPDDMYKIFDGWAGSGRDSAGSDDPDRTLAGPGQAQQLRDLDRPENARPNAPPPAPPGWKFEPVQ